MWALLLIALLAACHSAPRGSRATPSDAPDAPGDQILSCTLDSCDQDVSPTNRRGVEPCVALVNSACRAAAACSSALPASTSLPDSVGEQLEECDPLLESAGDAIRRGCQELAGAAGDTEPDVVTLLRSAPADTLLDCVDMLNESCNDTRLADLLTATTQLLEDPNTLDVSVLADLVQLLVGACNICIPQCEGKSCGHDGCGGSCGYCAPGESCVSGTCSTSSVACFYTNPKKVHFGGKLVGELATMEVAIHSCGSKPVSITSLRLVDPPERALSDDFSLDLGQLPGVDPGTTVLTKADPPVVVDVNGVVTFDVHFVPDAVNPTDDNGKPIPDVGIVTIVSNEVSHPYELVDVIGVGTNVECPTAGIGVAEGEEVTPADQASLRRLLELRREWRHQQVRVGRPAATRVEVDLPTGRVHPCPDLPGRRGREVRLYVARLGRQRRAFVH